MLKLGSHTWSTTKRVLIGATNRMSSESYEAGPVLIFPAKSVAH